MPDIATIPFGLGALLLLATMASSTLEGQGTASIEGRVTNSATGEAVSGVNVQFVDRRNHVYPAVTDSAGSYRIAGLDDGDYRGDFTRDGFSASYGNSLSRVAGFVPVRIDAQLKPWAALRGRVVDEDSMPAPGVRVELDSDRGLMVGFKVTDPNGEFMFAELPPGSYAVVAKPPSKIHMQDGVRLGMVAIYYPSATELAQAVRISVRTGQNVTGIEIKLKSVPVRRVTGVVLNEAGKPAAHATVKLMAPAGATREEVGVGIIMPGATAFTVGGVKSGAGGFGTYTMIGPAAETEVARVESHDDGTFEFPAVEAGDWRLSAEAGVDGGKPRAGVASLLVSDRDIEDIQIRLADSSAVEVTTDWRGDQSPLARQVTAFSLNLTPVEGQPSAMQVPDVEGLSVQAGEDAQEKMVAGARNRVFPGRYRVLPGTMQPGYHAVAVMQGGRDVNGQVVELAPGAAPLQAILSSGFGGVRGTVENGEGRTVFLVSGDSGEILTYRHTQCRAGGSFEFSEVPPGDYYVVAFDRTESDRLPPSDLPAEIAPLASRVRVEAGSKASVDLKIQKSPW